MCTLAVYFRVSPRFPVIVAANRDEFLARPAAAPCVIADDPWVVAGQDLAAGGTWLGVNECRMVVGLLNRLNPEGPDPRRRSRGLLCLEALQTRAPQEAVAHVCGEDPAHYNAFNLLVADVNEAYVITNTGHQIRVTPLEPEVHVLTNLDVNDPTCPRIAQSHRLFRAVPASSAADPETLLPHLRAILSDHTVPLDPRGESSAGTLCVHRGDYGTRSSSIVALPEGSEPMRYWHAAGPPCREPYVRVPLPAASPLGRAD